MNEPANVSSVARVETWQRHWSGLGSDDLAASSISAGVDQTRHDVLAVLAALD